MKEKIRENAAEIGRLHSRIHETVRHRHEGPKKRLEWEQACAEFHKRYSTLAFPGGYEGALARITSGDPNAMEVAICFLECRPYFFGYMFKDILRRCRRAPLSPQQAARLKTIEVKLGDWKQRKLMLTQTHHQISQDADDSDRG
jgi:hypothetical protein